MRELMAADLFCGAGGTSSGLLAAALECDVKLKLLAINHWDIAIQTHLANHPEVQHYCESLDNLNPRHLVPSGRLRLLVASPECTNHSMAKGGIPRSDQSRATAWHVLRWCEALRVDDVLIENVKEFMKWGPLDDHGHPVKSKEGDTFKAFVAALESLNYRVEYRVLTAADYGDPTTRKRLFIIARRKRKKIDWPIPSHSEHATEGMLPWRTAREIIDWGFEGSSIFGRKRPLAKSTMARIAAGLKKHGGSEAKPFLVMLYGTNKARSIDRPLPTVTAGGGHIALCQPFIIPLNHGAGDLRSYSMGTPMPTVTTFDAWAFVQPVLEPGTKLVDIKFRMLSPRELANAMSFPQDYNFVGNRELQVKQIGNAVPKLTAQALCKSLLAA